MIQPIPFETLQAVFKKAVSRGLVTPDDNSVIFFDVSRLEALVSQLQANFPPTSLHAVAIKANPLVSVIRHLGTLGCGAEAASMGELAIAAEAGIIGERVVFDSPAKTREELKFAFAAGHCINADSFSELSRIDEIVNTAKRPLPDIGVRINPQLSGGSVSYTFTAGRYSKFGIALKEKREELLNAFRKYSFLNTLHLHIGSQSCAVETLVEGIKDAVEFALAVDRILSTKRIRHIDIGGGLATSYQRGRDLPSFSEYSGILKAECPYLFSEEVGIITEFGRHLHATCGWAVSRVESVKEQCGIRTAIVHVGADMFLRECYNPGDWHHDFAVPDADGSLKNGALEKQTIAGPLCFSGDFLATEIELPRIEESDRILIGDVGAYTFSMWSRYNSRTMPAIIGYYDNGARFEMLKAKEPLESVVGFWR